MGLLSSADWAQMAAELADVRSDNTVSIDIRRGSTTVASQDVRIVRSGATIQERMSDGGGETRELVLIVGATSLNIQPEDRVMDADGSLYRVVAMRPNRRASTVAEAMLVAYEPPAALDGWAWDFSDSDHASLAALLPAFP